MTIDRNFDLRLMIIAAALTFPLSSLAVFKRVFFAYFAAMTIPVVYFIAERAYLRSWEVLLPSGLFYIAMIGMVSVNANRHIRRAIVDNLKVLTLTEKLQQALAAETQLRTELSVRADTDDLTDIFNRRGLMTHLNIELARCRRFPRSAAVLMIDIDHFKQVNDTYGHAAGDTVILGMVEAVKQQLRDTDIFGRLGGEEFLVVLPAMESEGALIAAERIRECVEKATIAVPGHTVRIAVSIGVAVYAPEDSADSMLARADDALYAAKHDGRNRVEIQV
jgi:diguanylate cyclase (GGDEF)-like protein